MVTPAHWLNEAVASIPVRSEAAFNQLWDEGRLKYINGSKGGDLIDHTNALLAISTLERGLRLLIVFPDSSPQRAPLLFASALITEWWDRKSHSLPPGRVMYFGTTVGVREHLSHTRVGTLALDSVFPQLKPSSRVGTHLRKGRMYPSDLPRVVCAYSPADPIALIEDYHPAWIAIDCGDESHIRWLPELLSHARDCRIPVIAWSHNPLSEAVRDFELLSEGQVIRWPFNLTNAGQSVVPIFVESSDGHFERCLQEAYRSLARAMAERGVGRLSSDAIRVTWSLQRSLEQLSVPLDLYEAEADHHWGVQRIAKLLAGAQRFIEALPSAHSQLFGHLSNALSIHEKVIQALRDSDPPLWAALRQLCVEEVPGDRERLIVFPSRAKEQMFALAILSRFNISEDDLKEIGISFTSLTELQGKYPVLEPDSPSMAIAHPTQNVQPTHARPPLLTFLPSVSLSTRMLPLLSIGGFDALIYSFQVSSLVKRIQEWNLALSVSPASAEKVVRARSGKMPPSGTPSWDPIVALGEGRVFSVATGKTTTARATTPLLPTLDETSEISWLMDEDQESDRNDAGTLQVQEEVVWTQEALDITLSGGWHGLFASDYTLNVVKQGPDGEHVEEEYVRSLRIGDHILYIHGQKRQSLYELVISRVHNHPAIEIHLALIEKWQQELVQAFSARRALGWTVEDVLTRIQEQNSSVTSSQTIRLWLTGRVLGPEDPKDLVRLAESMDMPFVKQYHTRINKAAQRIRGLHRGLSTRLNRWLKERTSGVIDTAFEVFDEELGLSFQDFRDSLAILKIEGITKVSGPFLCRSLGTLERR